MHWDGMCFVEAALPFGLRSASKIFNAIADALEWMMKSHGFTDIWHYLDDFIVCGPADNPICAEGLHRLIDVCGYLGIPLAEEKIAAPSTCMTFLGIEIDTVAGSVRLPLEKLQQLVLELRDWSIKRKCVRRDLESITGKLQHAAKVVKAGRSFVRRIITLN